MACNHHLWAAQTVERRRAWHAIIAFGQHRRSYDVGLCMLSSPLASTHSQTTSGVACPHLLWGAHRIKRCLALHAIIAFGQHIWWNDVGRGVPSLPLNGKHGRTTLGVTCHHCLWTADTVERRQVGHAIIVFGPHTRSKDVGCGLTSPPLDVTHGRTSLGVACHHHLWAAQTIE